MDAPDAYPIVLFALCLWREARGELYTTKTGVAWTIRNRVKNPRWWGHDWIGVILMPWQFSSFNHNDPNSSKFPMTTDPVWPECLEIASKVYSEPPTLYDNTAGAVSYFDASLDGDPPKWATDGSQIKTVDIGKIHFFKLA